MAYMSASEPKAGAEVLPEEPVMKVSGMNTALMIASAFILVGALAVRGHVRVERVGEQVRFPSIDSMMRTRWSNTSRK